MQDILLPQQNFTPANYTVKNGVFQNTLGALCSPGY